MAASHYQLGSLVCIVDRNQLGIDGPTEDIMTLEPINDRFAAFGWEVQRIDGHDVGAIAAAFDRLDEMGRDAPHVIIANTLKGKGVRRMERQASWHVGNLNAEDYQAVVDELVKGSTS